MTEAAAALGKIFARSAGLVVLRRERGEWRCLVLRAYRNWDFPKGMPEPGEDLLHTALRETTEETGLTELKLAWGEDFRETAPYGRGKIARFYLASSEHGDVHLPISPELGRPEHHAFLWATLDEARGLMAARFWPILAWASDIVEGKSPLRASPH